MSVKDLIPKELQPFFDKAKSNGCKQGQHLFNFLTEIDMMKYDNIKEELTRKKREKDFKDLEYIHKEAVRLANYYKKQNDIHFKQSETHKKLWLKAKQETLRNVRKIKYPYGKIRAGNHYKGWLGCKQQILKKLEDG